MQQQDTNWLLREKYQGVESEAFHSDCAHLEAGMPLGYLIGHVPFLNTTIHLNSHPLIPRPETEFWTEQAIVEISKQTMATNEVKARTPYFKEESTSSLNLRDGIPKILDLCAGSGAIGVAVAKALPGAQVIFTEIDPTHLPTIETNINANLSTDRKVSVDMYSVVQSDLFKNVSDTFDFILTNPPYINKAAKTVDVNVTLHEPHLALFGGVAGIEIIERIIAEAPDYLNPGGQLWIEHEPAQAEAILILAQTAGYVSTVTHPDQYGVLRFSVLTMAQ